MPALRIGSAALKNAPGGSPQNPRAIRVAARAAQPDAILHHLKIGENNPLKSGRFLPVA
jgi:hypothetical protein